MTTVPEDRAKATRSEEDKVAMKQKLQQFVPPELSFDALYLYPSQEYEKSKEFYQAALRQQEALLAAEEKHERAKAGEADAHRSLIEAERNRYEGERRAAESRTQRENELHSTKMRDQKQQFEEMRKTNETFKLAASEAKEAQTRAENKARDANAKVQGIGGAIFGLCCVLVVISLYGGFRWGFSHGYNADVEAQVTSLQEVKASLETDKVSLEADKASLESKVRSLTPPEPDSTPIDAAEVKKLLLERYKKWDTAHDEEKMSALLSVFNPHFVVETQGHEDDLSAWKTTTAQDFFQADTLHTQLTQITESSAPAAANTSAGSSGSDAGADSSRTRQESSTGITILDHNTVVVSVLRTNTLWKGVLVTAAPPPATTPVSDTQGTAAASEPSSQPSESSSSADSAPKTSVECRATERRGVLRETWKRKQGEWSLVKSEVISVSERTSSLPVPVRKCRSLTCGEYYVTGVSTAFSETGKAIKTCPTCGRSLYFIREGQ